jgi:DNA-binding GntR family transcriptional regulator
MARDLPPGMVLTLRQIAGIYGVSPTPVRDAFLRLQNDGLVRYGGKQGATVVGLGRDDVSDYFGARLALESYASRIAAPTASETFIEEMREIAIEFPKTFEGDTYTDYDRFQTLDNRFHLNIISATENRRLLAMYQALNIHLHLARIYQREVEQRAQANHSEHIAILEALEHHDPEAMVRAVELHIVNVREHILSKLLPGHEI